MPAEEEEKTEASEAKGEEKKEEEKKEEASKTEDSKAEEEKKDPPSPADPPDKVKEWAAAILLMAILAAILIGFVFFIKGNL